MENLVKVDPQEISSEISDQAGGALLVCAYDSDEKFRENHLEGAIPLSALQRMEPSLAKDREIIFYCHCPNDETATSRAKEYMQKGFTGIKVLKGGVEAWAQKGYALI